MQPREARREHWIPNIWSIRQLWAAHCGHWELNSNSGLLHEQNELSYNNQGASFPFSKIQIVLKIKVYVPRFPKCQTVLLACETHSRSINDRHEFFNIRHQHTIKELLISILQIHQQKIPVEIGHNFRSISNNQNLTAKIAIWNLFPIKY